MVTPYNYNEGERVSLSRFDRILAWIENFLAAATLGAASALAIVAVILRYVFDYVIFWSGEAVIYLIIFSTFVGAVITLRHNEHVSVDILQLFLGGRGKKILTLLGSLMLVGYCGIIGLYAWILVAEPSIRNTTTAALDLPLWVVYLALPIGLTLMLLRSLEIIYRTALDRQTFPEAENTDEYGEETVE